MRLSATDLACRRGGRDVFAGVSFSVASGESLTIRGRNGAGKSSLLRMMAGPCPSSRRTALARRRRPRTDPGRAGALSRPPRRPEAIAVGRRESAVLVGLPGRSRRRSRRAIARRRARYRFPTCRRPICPPANGGGFRSRACSRSSVRYGFSTSRPRHLMPRRKSGSARSCRRTWPAAASSSRRRTARCNSTARGS